MLLFNVCLCESMCRVCCVCVSVDRGVCVCFACACFRKRDREKQRYGTHLMEVFGLVADLC